MRRFHVRPEAVSGTRVAFDAEESRHLTRVLRLGAGAVVEALDGAGGLLTVRIERVGPRGAEGTILERGESTAESPCRLVLAQGMRLVAAGSAIGLALGLAAGRLISGRQFGIAQADPIVLAGAAFLFGVVGLVACYIPVRRASTIKAVEALRYE